MENVLSQYGLAGLVISVLASVVWYQERRYERIQEKRLSEILEFNDKYMTATSGVTKSVEALTAHIYANRGK